MASTSTRGNELASHGEGHESPGNGSRRDTPAPRREETGSTETKSAFKTTEFVAYVLVFAGILIAAAIIGGGDDRADDFVGRQAWLYVTILTAAYFIGRGLAKSGSVEIYKGDEGNQLKR